MQLQTAERKKAKIKIGLQGSSGSGKSMSALLLAYGLCQLWEKVAVIDTENGSAHLYSHLGNYNVLSISVPFSPEKYCEAIRDCEKAGMEVIIIDSISHEWEGSGGILDIHGSMAGNSFINWNKVTPRHNAFISAILQSPAHVIVTIRTKQDYILVEKNGKQVPEKVGLKAITRDGTDYELTIVFDLDIKHYATASKDRTGIFASQPELKITIDTGKIILDWCNSGAVSTDVQEPGKAPPPALNIQQISQRIEACKSLTELLDIYKMYPQHQESLLTLFSNKKQALEHNPILQIQNNRTNGNTNGTGTYPVR